MKTAVFTTTDVKALIEGAKTRFSLKMKKQPHFNKGQKMWELTLYDSVFIWEGESTEWEGLLKLAPFQPGDKVGIKEAWAAVNDMKEVFSHYAYKADADPLHENIKWNSPVTMPPEAIRIYVEILSVKAQRLQEISWEDAEQEGCYGYRPTQYEPTHEFKDKMIKAKGMGFWNSNPWMWSFSFRVLTTKGEPI